MNKIIFTILFLICISILHAQVLYGTASDGGGGINSQGTICKLTTSTNTLTAAYTFDDPNPEGRFPSFLNLVQAADGKLYGMTTFGGLNNDGIIFSLDPASGTYTKLRNFDSTNGINPYGSFLKAADGKLYAMTNNGGSLGFGAIFSFNPATSVYTKLKDFDSTNGAYPFGSLIQASDGKLYGMTTFGGLNNDGTIFSFNTATAAFSKLKDLDSTNGANPYGSLLQATDGKMYGMTLYGGSSNLGVVFSFNPATATYTRLIDFTGTNGANPYGSFIQGTNGKLYGMTFLGGANSRGAIFSINPVNAAYTKLKDFTVTLGYNPYGNLLQASDGKLYGMTNEGGINSDGVLFSFTVSTGTYTKLADFNGSNGASPRGSLMQASDGKLYGATRAGGNVSYGVVFSYNPSGATYTKLKNLGVYINGSNIVGGLTKDAAGKLYGMFAEGGGLYGFGGIYSFDTATAVYNKLIDFDSANGSNPHGSLTLAKDGKLYGMTCNGGSLGYGVIFSFNPATATYTKLKDLDSINGRNPQGSLMQAADGKLYGMTSFGGVNDEGVLFSFNPSGAVYTKLIDFNDANGATPFGGLIQAADGKLYGMTTFGGNVGAGTLFSFNTATSAFNKIYDFTGFNGAYPYGNLTQAANGALYGTTYSGGSSGVGVIFSFNTATAAYAKLKDFDIANGRNPRGSLMQASDNKLYGMTNFGGANDYGVAFSYAPGTATYTRLNDFNGINGQYPVYSFFTEPGASVKLRVNDVAMPEGNSGTKNMTFTVSLSAASSQSVTVSYKTVNGTAVAPSDYVSKTGTLTFAPGVKQQTVAVIINGDTQAESNETMKLVLSNPVNATLGDGTGVGTIQNDDGAFASLTMIAGNLNNSVPAILVSPNPTASICRIELNGYTGNVTLQLAAINGKVLKENKVLISNNLKTTQQQFNVADIAGGNYLIIVKDENGNRQTAKLVITH